LAALKVGMGCPGFLNQAARLAASVGVVLLFTDALRQGQGCPSRY
jgi:hypothetical protein